MKPASSYRLLLVCLIWVFSISALFAQKRVKVSIIDPGQLYSTYEFSEGELEATSLPAKIQKDIITYGVESNWPESIQGLGFRTDNPEKMKKYKVYKIAEINENRCILVVPAKENKKMPKGMKPSRDIYFIMGLDGIE